MSSAVGARSTWGVLVLVVVVLGLWLVARPALAIEFWDERIQVHGFAETRMSFGYEDFNSKNKIDMYGWLQVLNVEIESEIAPEGWGPFDMIAAYSRIEVKYDCVWNHACGTLPSVDAFGNTPKNLPHRAQTGERTGVTGSQITFDTRPYWFADRALLNAGFHYDAKAGQRAAKSLFFGSTNVALGSASAGPDAQLGEFTDVRDERFSVIRPDGTVQDPIFYDGVFTNPATMLPGDDDAGTYLYNRTSRCRVGNWQIKEPNLRSFDNRELLWSIDDCRIEPTGFQRRIANPWADAFDDPLIASTAEDVNPVLLALNLDPNSAGYGFPLEHGLGPDGIAGTVDDVPADGIPNKTALPFRPGPEKGINAGLGPDGIPGTPDDVKAEKARRWESQGLWMPNFNNRNKLRRHEFNGLQQDFSLNELRWNRGASQQEWKELRELYLEFEAFESRLWVRAGMQTVVWGKTELFRNQDQWNPVDIAIGPLASLEESRVAQWMLRGIWSFYEVGPLEDVRLELVGLLDNFQSIDIGRCGEPYVPRLACNKSYGAWVHSTTGMVGVAGEIRPPNPWDNLRGAEAGVRVEFRYDRFSFALTDYYGYSDTPFTPLLFEYSRNVDPITGLPRHTQSKGRCETGAEEPCLRRFIPGQPGGNELPVGKPRNLVEVHSINQALFATICAGTVGVAPQVDASACAFTLFNAPVGPLGPFSQTISFILAGRDAGASRNTGQYALIIGDAIAANPATPDLIQASLDAAFGPGGRNTLFPYSTEGTGSPLVPLVYNGPADGGAATLGGVLPRAARQQLATFLTDEQEALLGCGPVYLTNCNTDGVDLANAEANVLLQTFPWFEGTRFNPNWDTADASLPQPGTVDAVFNAGGERADIDGDGDPDLTVNAPDSKPGELETGPAGTRFENDNDMDDDGDGRIADLFNLPGSRYDPAVLLPIVEAAEMAGIPVDPYVRRNLAQYDITQDGSVVGVLPTEAAGFGCDSADAACFGTQVGVRRHPFTGQIFSNEMAIFSWDLLMLTAALGAQDGTLSRSTLDRNQPLALGRCSYRQPQFCAFVSGLASVARLTRSSVRAGGNGHFGRRNFVWASIGDVTLEYEKRNIVGFGMDFAEDTTKSSWGVEFTWLDDVNTADNDAFSGLTDIDEYNLTLSVDRPTFINFLNANRTFFLNSQLFMSYLQGYTSNMLRDGPFTALWLIVANTGYFQDRFLVSTAAVYDFTSQSMAFLPSVQYRFTENFSITIGAAALAGKWKGGRKMGVNQFSATDDNRLNDTTYVENLVSPVRDLDNFFLRLRYTF